VSVPLLLLGSSMPPGSKALAALVDAKGGELTALFADIDSMLGGEGSAKATQRKLRPLVAAGWAMTRKSVTGHVTIRLRRTVGDLWTDCDPTSAPSPSTGPVENRPVALGGRGFASSNSHDLNDPPEVSAEPNEQSHEEPKRPQSTSSDQGHAPPHVGLDVGHGERSQGRAAPSACGGLPAGSGIEETTQLALVAEPPATPRIPRGWSCSPDELAAMKRVNRALWEAREAAGMPVGAKPNAVNKTHCGPHRGCPGLLGRYRELVIEGEANPAALLGAVVRAKVEAQGKNDDSDKHRGGVFSTGITICREQYWSTNLAMGRVLLERDNKPAKAPEPIDTGPVAGPMPTDIGATQEAQRKTMALLEEGQRKARRARR
jgi:hypothetical protein